MYVSFHCNRNRKTAGQTVGTNAIRNYFGENINVNVLIHRTDRIVKPRLSVRTIKANMEQQLYVYTTKSLAEERPF